ncbi:F-box protein At1g55000-like [Pyrus x bretschneideri]|uniref:F-box protein At1g55000-like n=1 Tax=Pyrus x bretschneideri TaxID=225117 RepID=UPI00202F0410|nr:F-box protein At1g55000-like [Pyrus x bretschneideri]
MGCCGDEENDDDIHNPPNAGADTTSTQTLGEYSDSTTTISTMNSHFPALTYRDTLLLIFEKLPIPDLARSSCVCRVWNSVASDQEIVDKAFKSPWNLKEVLGKPSSLSFWRDNSIGKFAISHRIVRGDSVASLAVKYSVQVMDIKRLNNMMSEHGIYSRERLLIPISNAEMLSEATCYVEVDNYAKREVAVLYLEGGPDPKTIGSSSSSCSVLQTKKRVVESLRRSLQVDDATVNYYLSISGGDPRAAISQFSQDLRWETHTHPGFA